MSDEIHWETEEKEILMSIFGFFNGKLYNLLKDFEYGTYRRKEKH